MKKLLSCFLFLCFAAAAYAQDAAYDDAAFTMPLNNPGDSAAVLSLLSRGSGLKAFYNGDEIFNLMSRLRQAPGDENGAQIFKEVIKTVTELEPVDTAVLPFNMREIMRAQNLRSGYCPLHNIAVYTPSKAQSSYQSILLDAFVTNDKLNPYFCEAFALKDKSGNTALDLAGKTGNKEAFNNLLAAAKTAGCPGVDGLSPSGAKKLSAKDMAKLEKESKERAVKAVAGADNPRVVTSVLEQPKTDTKRETAQNFSAPKATPANTEVKQSVPPAPRQDSKKLPVNDANLKWAKSQLSGKQMQTAAVRLNRLDAYKALGHTDKDEYIQGYSNLYKKTMRAKDSPFARFDKNKYSEVRVSSAYNEAVLDYRAKNPPDEEVMMQKLDDCDKLEAQRKLKPKKFNEITSGLEDLQYAIIDASGDKYIDRACFDSIRVNVPKNKTAAPAPAPVRQKEIEEVTPVTKSNRPQTVSTQTTAQEQQPEVRTESGSSDIELDGMTAMALPLVKNKKHGPEPAAFNINERSLTDYYGEDNFKYIGWRAQQLAVLNKDVLSMAAGGQSYTPEFARKRNALEQGILALSRDIKLIKLKPEPALLYYNQLSQ